ncbi:winged helix DNA-binding protein [Aurantiacibacter gangjinensis]|uniref:HTH marR-type domain-containing protein n=1 Tax=Aurantiacibacter gangjinensis TaxID=502682 RepID=A0A0G9MN48_9SPHN|nr:winged helix DNA-binding protein [Aurantiacibacter gangjinensis]APE28179.1 hypothetical protein BMF35_a1350 [Aurantiacibacter gangjinensis]KLE32084.1 hypothetical protein AAW01_11770 [Aurantiacibacter gangjinensis]
MADIDFAYEVAADSAGFPMAVSIFADDDDVRDAMREDVSAAGFTLREARGLSALGDGGPQALGELVLLDCPVPDAAALAGLMRMDTRVARSGARMIVATSAAGLEDVFGACVESRPQILVDPLRAERVIAIGRMLAEQPKLRLRELSETDRLALLRLTEQVGKIAERLDGLDRNGWGQDNGAGPESRSAFRFESPVDGYNARQAEPLRRSKTPLPSARLVRKIIAARKARARFVDPNLFADPAWDMLLDLTAARVEHQRVSVTSLCIASGVPPTTALRWIGQMVDAGLFERVDDELDRRRAFIRLTDKAADAMARYFAEVGQDAVAFA